MRHVLRLEGVTHNLAHRVQEYALTSITTGGVIEAAAE
jgi:hypothetical protein